MIPPTPVLHHGPHLPQAAAEKWQSEVGRSNVMIEYGAGGSTLAAICQVSLLITVETDYKFLQAVEHRVRGMKSRGAFHPIHVDIGLTTEWGFPAAVRPTARRLAKWRAYPAAPWLELERLGALPDVVFVDGRFRVACVLESLLRLPEGANCNFLMDDFLGREDLYGAILEHVTEVTFHDRMVSFRRKDDFDKVRCRATLESYLGDYN